MLKISANYLGKWVAIKDEKIIASDVTLTKLTKKMSEKEYKSARFTLVPKGLIAG